MIQQQGYGGQDQTIIQDRGLFGTKETTIDQNASRQRWIPYGTK